MRVTPPLALVSPSDPASWDELVKGAQGASVFHTSEWAQLWTAQWRDAEWRALVLPSGAGYAGGIAMIIRRRPFGRAVLSMPFGTYGGPIVRRHHQNPGAVRRQLFEAYARLVHDRRVLISDLTWHQGDSSELPPGRRGVTTFTHARPLTADFEALFHTLPHAVRARVRQSVQPQSEDAKLSRLPTTFALMQNQPNPFARTTRIRFELPRAEHVRLEVFDLQGRLVRRLADARYEAGRWAVEWNLRSAQRSAAPAGVYLYRMIAGGYRIEKKMVVLP
jgi:hypothetical protein